MISINAIKRRCANRIAVLLIGGVVGLPALPVGATPPDDPETVKKSDVRLDGYNAAGLCALSATRASMAEAWFDKSGGGLVNYHESDDAHRWGLRTESFFRTSPRTAMYGRMGYENFAGRNMGGSAFIDPYLAPFDLVEWDDASTGRKRMERYALVGAVATELRPGLGVGGKIDYLAANYAKMKDLRHKNKLLDMSLSAGATCRVNEWLEFGANYIYRRRTEGVEFDTYGNTDRQYYTLVSYGAFFGRREIAGDVGYTSKGDDKPLFDEYHGLSVQAMVEPGPDVAIFNEFTFKSRRGYYGVKSPNDVVYTGHRAAIMEYRGVYAAGGHRVCLDAAYESLTNDENVYRRQVDEGGGADIVYYGETEVLRRSVLSAEVRYEGPVVGASARYWSREQTASVYPYYRKQQAGRLDLGLSARFDVRRFSLSGALGYGFGGGTPADDRQYTSPAEGQDRPDAVETLLQREYEYLTARRASASLGVRFATDVATGVAGYVACDGAFTRGFGLKYLDRSHYAVTIRTGCFF